MSVPVLITIPFSHFCEKARWGLQRTGISFTEEPHLLHIKPVRRAGGRRSVPVLVTDEGVICDSTDILTWADRKAAPGSGLYGDSPEERREIEALEHQFDEELGPHTRRWVYFYLLPRRDILLAMGRAVPEPERKRWSLLYPVLRVVMRWAMSIHAEGAERSRARIDKIFVQVAQQLADGRPYLVGTRLSAADLAFASLAAPAVMPEGYGAPLPRLEELPPAMAAQCAAWQQHAAGMFALRIYREHR